MPLSPNLGCRQRLSTETDFRTPLLSLRARSPDAIYMNMLLPQIAPMVRQARSIGISEALFFNFYVAKREVIDAVGAAGLEGVRYVDLDTDLPKLRSKLTQYHDSPPPGLTVASYVATRLLAQAVADTGSIATPAELQAALLRQHEVRTPDHVYPIEDRYVKFPLSMKVMRSGRGSNEGP